MFDKPCTEVGIYIRTATFNLFRNNQQHGLIPFVWHICFIDLTPGILLPVHAKNNYPGSRLLIFRIKYVTQSFADMVNVFSRINNLSWDRSCTILPQFIVFSKCTYLRTWVFIKPEPESSSGSLISVYVNTIFNQKRNLCLESIIIYHLLTGDIEMERSRSSAHVFTWWHWAHPNWADKFTGIGNIDTCIPDVFQIALSNFSQFFLACLDSNGINKGLHLVWITIYIEISRSNNGGIITMTTIHLRKDTNHVTGFLGCLWKQNMIVQKFKQFRAEGPAFEHLLSNLFLLSVRFVWVKQTKTLTGINIGSTANIAIGNILSVLE